MILRGVGVYRRAIDLLKVLLYRGGVLQLYHWLRNRRTLTVVMFHRVLPPVDPRSLGADPEWTITPDLFRQCLRFFQRHFTVISLTDLHRHQSLSSALPSRSLLITFDDGWADNEEYALPILQAEKLPAVIFVVSSAIGRTRAFWPEELYAAWATEKLSRSEWAGLTQAAGMDLVADQEVPLTEERVKQLIGGLARQNECTRAAELAKLDLRPVRRGPAQMLSPDQLRRLHEAGIAIGSHGVTHTPLNQVEDPKAELCDSRQQLCNQLAIDETEVSVLSFPHGKFDGDLQRLATESGYVCLFTSEPHLNSIDLSTDAAGMGLGRLHISAREIADLEGRLRPERLALWLFRRPRGNVDA